MDSDSDDYNVQRITSGAQYNSQSLLWVRIDTNMFLRAFCSQDKSKGVSIK